MPALKFQRECVTKELCEELIPLLVAHFSETAHFKDIQFRPDYNQYIALESRDALRVFIARDDGKIVGYNAFFVNKNIHQSTSKQAYQDVLFIDKDSRGFGQEFVRWCDEELFKEQIDIVYQNVPIENDYGERILAPLGYKKIESVYAKRMAA